MSDFFRKFTTNVTTMVGDAINEGASFIEANATAPKNQSETHPPPVSTATPPAQSQPTTQPPTPTNSAQANVDSATPTSDEKPLPAGVTESPSKVITFRSVLR